MTLHFDTNLSPSHEDKEEWKWGEMTLKNQPLQHVLGSTTFWHFSESSKSDPSPHAVQSNMPGHRIVCFCLFCNGVLLYVVKRFAESSSSLEEMKTRSQASSVIRQCPVTAVSGVGYMRLPLSHITSLPLSGHRISNPISHKPAQTEAMLTQEWGSMVQQRQEVVWSGWRAVGLGGHHGLKNETETIMEGWWREIKIQGDDMGEKLLWLLLSSTELLYNKLLISQSITEHRNVSESMEDRQKEQASKTNRDFVNTPLFVKWHLSFCSVAEQGDNDLSVRCWDGRCTVWGDSRSFHYHTLILHSHCDINRERTCISSFTEQKEIWIWYPMTAY